MDRIEDIGLVTQVAVFHNRRAFDKLTREYQSPVRRFFLGQTLGDTQLSDDLAQDTFVKAYTHIGQFRGQSSFLTWLFRIAYNVFYDYTRGLRPTSDLDTPAVTGRSGGSGDGSLRDAATHGGAAHREDFRDYGHAPEHGEKPPFAR